ncbi:hypothetical protein [Laspinema olomoucense]|uniref:hypothetical protein n=1 Tax=Laspinema olomoucense TaxID=3231600 RepID=UPI0021BB3F73|nr:hypothetical protein [Laspinema sp. D3d]MCT7971161.1 hypothetical protein [Laspinema sp. D3d]
MGLVEGQITNPRFLRAPRKDSQPQIVTIASLFLTTIASLFLTTIAGLTLTIHSSFTIAAMT